MFDFSSSFFFFSYLQNRFPFFVFLTSPVGIRKAASGTSLAFPLAAYNRILQLPFLCSIDQGKCRSCYQNAIKAEFLHRADWKVTFKPVMSLSSVNVSKLTSLFPTVLVHFALFDVAFMCLHYFQPVTPCLTLFRLQFFLPSWTDYLLLRRWTGLTGQVRYFTVQKTH